MEIINYVGSRSVRSGNKVRLPKFKKYRNDTRFSSNNSIGRIGTAGFNTAATVRFQPAYRSFSFPSFIESLKAKKQFFKLLPVFAVFLLLPFAVSSIYKIVESYHGPFLMETLPGKELEELNTAMSQFALQQDTPQYDDNGNILDSDGTVLKPNLIKIYNKVAFKTYTVKSGDTISGITRNAGLTNISTLIGVNDIDNVRELKAGQKIKIPSLDGLNYVVKSGDTLVGISLRYNTAMEDILDVNDLSSQKLLIGQKLFIPGAKLDSSTLKKAMGDLFSSPIKAKFRISSPFGWRPDPFTGQRSFHTGIDMAVPQGTPIYAAMSGKIAFVGWSNVFGNYVIINHENGYQTLYAHMVKTLAHKGQWISQGTRIGLVGTTGYSTGPHLHFTVYKNGKLINPLTVLNK